MEVSSSFNELPDSILSLIVSEYLSFKESVRLMSVARRLGHLVETSVRTIDFAHLRHAHVSSLRRFLHAEEVIISGLPRTEITDSPRLHPVL
jgi:hypothetical protein